MEMDYDIELNWRTADSSEYDVIVDDEVFETLVTHNCCKVKEWITETENKNQRRLHRLIVGLDVEWRPNTITGEVNPVAILQLFVGKRCLIYQFLQGVHEIPKVLKKFLKNINYTFVGVGIEQDKQKLIRDHSLEVTKTKDLREMAAYELSDRDLCYAGLKKLTKVILGKDGGYKKELNVTMSDWDRNRLSKEQVLYACLDAYVSFEIGRQLQSWYD
ncbi:hypothetical protein QVD17_11623 [Tagetes erecta]|uniref:3'-5' exonuclease domain-containing protein n=1 Tax=Tagetes erecta TaxID=13708 RepID=A0AAD8KVI1_TARER|nr:hypothetical protein QVD17_11623 [Tagetes erecta]